MLNYDQKELLSRTLSDLGKIAIGSLAIGQIFAKHSFSAVVFLYGIGIFGLSTLTSIWILKKREGE